MIITREYLENNPTHIFVFGDNLLRKGYGGAAKLRDMPNSYGFVTKRYPDNLDESFYRPREYLPVYEVEVLRLKSHIYTGNLYLISKLGAGLANKYHIFEKVIEPRIKKDLAEFDNVKFLW